MGGGGGVRRLAFGGLIAVLIAGGDVRAQVEAPPQGGASPGSQADIPTDKPKLRAFCADRPGQGTLPCTVDPGRLQIETDLFNVSYDRSGSPGQETYLFTNPVVKFGVAPRADVN